MTVAIPVRAIELAPGSTISLANMSWQAFEDILDELGDKRSTRVAYHQGTLEIMSPLAMQVPEVWVYRHHQLQIFVLGEPAGYREVAESPTFPTLPLVVWLPQLVQQAMQLGTSRMLRELRLSLQTETFMYPPNS